MATHPKPYIMLLILFLSSPSIATSGIYVNAKNALFSLNHYSVPIVSTNFVAWSMNWKWSGTRVQPALSPDSHSFLGKNKNLDISMSGSMESAKNVTTWHYHFSVSKSHPNAIGYGINFKLDLDSPSLKGLAKEPELLPNNTGWRWQISPQETIEVYFSKRLASVHFERGRKNKIRAMFFGAVSKGDYSYDMSLKIKGIDTSPVHYQQSTSDKLTQKWHPDMLPWNSAPIDLSFLNAGNIPAGKHGMLKAKGDSLAFEDGTPARFWGVNIQASALFKTSDSNIKLQAKRLARLGFNLVRFHHHDSAWVHPNIFANPKHDTLTLNPDSLKKIDWWIKCLKDEGIYVWLDLQVGRSYTAMDGIENYNEIVKSKPNHSLKGFNYYNKSIQLKIMRFNSAYLNHINTFTKLAYKDEPAIISTLLINENDLTHHFGNLFLPDKKNPKHHALYSADVKKAAKRLGLNPRQAWRSWEFGDSKIYLNDAEHRYNQKMLGYLRKIGTQDTLVTGSTWGGMSLAGLPSLTDGDIIDVHSYGSEGELLFNPHYRAGLLSWIGAAQVTNKPLSVTEWNVEKFPVSDRFTIPTWLASVAALQGWDSLMLYGYSQRPLNSAGHGSNYSTYNDPALMAMMPASALLYRQGHVSESTHHYHIRLSKQDFFGKPVTPATSASLRTLVEQSKVSIDLPYSDSLPWLKEYEHAMMANYDKKTVQQHIVTNPDIDFIPLNQHIITSDTGELSRDWTKGIHTINTAKSQIVSGNIGAHTIKLDHVYFKMVTPKATVAVQSMDGKAISQSNHLLISLAARSIPSNNARIPFLSEPVIGKLFIKAKRGLVLYRVMPDRYKAIETVYSNSSGYEITLSGNLSTPWLILK